MLNLADESGIAHPLLARDGHRADSVDLLRKLLDRFGTSLKCVLVRNQVRGTDFAALRAVGRAGARARPGREDRLGEEAARQRDPEDRHQQQQLLARHTHTDSPIALGLMDRQRVEDVAARRLLAISTTSGVRASSLSSRLSTLPIAGCAAVHRRGAAQ